MCSVKLNPNKEQTNQKYQFNSGLDSTNGLCRVKVLLGTYFSKSAQRAQKAHCHQAQHEHLSPVGQKVWVLIHDSSDDGFQTSKLDTHTVYIYRYCTAILKIYVCVCKHTVLSNPSVIIIAKKMMAKNVEPIILAMASG